MSDDTKCCQEYIESLPLTNTPEVFGLHTNAEIGYYTNAAKDMWSCLIDLQPQTGDAGAGISREAHIDKVLSPIHTQPAVFITFSLLKGSTLM